MNLKKLLDVSPHIEKALYFSGISITAFAAHPLFSGWRLFALNIVVYGLLILAVFQLI